MLAQSDSNKILTQIRLPKTTQNCTARTANWPKLPKNELQTNIWQDSFHFLTILLWFGSPPVRGTFCHFRWPQSSKTLAKRIYDKKTRYSCLRDTSTSLSCHFNHNWLAKSETSPMTGNDCIDIETENQRIKCRLLESKIFY